MESQLWIILLIGAGTYLFRAGSLVLGSRVQWSERTKEWLSYVSPAVLGALLGPLLLLDEGQWVPIKDNIMLLAAIPTIATAWWTRRLLLTVTAGIACFAVLYYFM
ncbi:MULTISPECIES: AzlD domain-containing protein [Paenibacillus]|uniref:AzlD domain-containing protein n=1 Tax=Paenibacillus woosongensis TaxID=307580 RepID=A0A7X3CL63_9BACL|nr:AzlD domain-containing protein [Paenibacillus woosongensis]MUG44053.1 AzlD domain-containing protein [Paenibacillus woosongensis]